MPGIAGRSPVFATRRFGATGMKLLICTINQNRPAPHMLFVPSLPKQDIRWVYLYLSPLQQRLTFQCNSFPELIKAGAFPEQFRYIARQINNG